MRGPLRPLDMGVSEHYLDLLLLPIWEIRVYIFIVYVALGFAFMYRIDRKRHGEIMEELQRRRARNQG